MRFRRKSSNRDSGSTGERTIKTRVYSSNGQKVDRQELSNEETLAPCHTNRQRSAWLNRLWYRTIHRKAEALPQYPLTYTDETRVEKINFSIREEETDELVRDVRQITTQVLRRARLRLASTVLTVKRLTAKELSNEETLAPVTQIVKVSTAKPTMVPNDPPKAEALPEYPLTYTDETRVEQINFTIREEETDELVQDARQIATPGVQGERTIKTRVYSSNDQKSTAKSYLMKKLQLP